MSDLAIDLYNLALDLDNAMADANLAAFPTMRKWDDQDAQAFQDAIRRLQTIAAEMKRMSRGAAVEAVL